jgi:polyferredoxin
MKVWARRAVQGLFLLLFFFLFLKTEFKGTDDLGYPVGLFLEADPLLALSASLSSRSLPTGAWLCLAVAGATVLLGRVFCGWVCPLGTLHNIFGAMGDRRGPQRVRGWFRAKYLLLAFLLAGSAVGIQLTGIFDPMSLLVRHMAVGIDPAVNYAANGAMGSVPASGPLAAAAHPVYAFLKNTVLAFRQPHFAQGAPMALLLFAVLLLNLVERRLWCRYVCPLGALLGLLCRFAPFKRRTSDACNSCGLCDRKCQGGIRASAWAAPECLYCMACTRGCPKRATSFGLSAAPAGGPVSPGRRGVLLAGGAGLASVAVSRTALRFDPGRPRPELIRPPGALPELEFLARCVKCGECMKVCPTNGLQPTLLEAGLEGVWSPVLNPLRGHCEHSCTLCGQVCPTGAIRRLSPERKREWRIGTAMFDRSRCLPYAHYENCMVCEEVCPTPKKSIWFRDIEAKDREGNARTIKRPFVDLKHCTGCGICVNKCPIVDAPGIRVTSIGETRSERNQLLLGGGPGGGPY